MPEVATDTTGVAAGTADAAPGLVFSLVPISHGPDEYPGELMAVLYGVLLPPLVSIAILLGGVWIVRHDWSGRKPWRLVGWMVGSLVVGVGLSGLILRYQLAEGVTPSDPLFVQAMFGTYGGVLGLLIGWDDDQRSPGNWSSNARPSGSRCSRASSRPTSETPDDGPGPVGARQGRIRKRRPRGGGTRPPAEGSPHRGSPDAGQGRRTSYGADVGSLARDLSGLLAERLHWGRRPGD